LPELQQRTRERIEELQKLQATKAARAKPLPVSAKATAEGDVFDAAQLDAMPRPMKQVPPAYPAALRDFGITGRARVSFVIDAEGKVVDAKVLSSTHDAFEQPALDALAEWKFAPGQKNGAAVNARVQMVLVFELERDDTWF
jgi:protein TonB